MSIGAVSAQRSRITKTRKQQRTHRVVKKHKKARGKKKTARWKASKRMVDVDPRLNDPNYNPYLQCEDTCDHVHGIDLSHYQGEVFWETVGENTKTAYVYLKATEGGDRIDERYEQNIDLAHRYGLKVGSYHFFRPKSPLHLQLQNFMTQCRPGEQDLIPMIDIETTGGLPTDVFCDSLFTFLAMVEKAYRQAPLIYTYRNFYNKHLVGKLDDYKLMIAMYTPEEPELADGRDITMWQYTSKGRIIGVSGYVDKSRFMGKHGLRDIRFRHIHPVRN
ncbi:MAG: glycosyl hydrolase family 25 [Prevotella sp.]|nr:glycosyl hydrolase family 25 [Prevotella sp.]